MRRLTFGRGEQVERTFVALIPDCSSHSSVEIVGGKGAVCSDENRVILKEKGVKVLYRHVGETLVE